MKKNTIKLNIGCGPTGHLKGFENLDNSPSVLLSRIPFIKRILYRIGVITRQQYLADWRDVIRCDVTKRIPYKDETIDKIYSSHFLEHVPIDKGERFLKECCRVMKMGATMRLVIPDLFWHAEKYVDNTRRLLEKIELPDNRTHHDQFLESVYGAYLTKKRYGALHCYMYDLPTLISLLHSVGFKKIRTCHYREEGFDEELAAYDSRPEDSLHLEVKK